MKVQYQKVNGISLAYALYGEGEIGVVIEMGLGSTMGEWRHMAKALSGDCAVLLYERAGYGHSEISPAPRTPENIAGELCALLNHLPRREKITLLAHSQGGLYARQFARLYPNMLEKLVLLDPLSPSDNRFSAELSPQEYQKSGVDKRSGLKINLLLARLHLGCIIKAFMRKAPPFYYYDFPPAERDEILAALAQPKIYQTALAEYELAHREEYLLPLRDRANFPPIPLCLITHSPKIMIEEIMQFGGVDEAGARKIETLWQQIMSDCLTLTPRAAHITAPHSSHYIHLTDPSLVISAVKNRI